MGAAFERVLELSLSGGIIAAVVLCLRPLLYRAPRRMLCLLWMIAVLRLLVPFELQSPLSLQPEPGMLTVPMEQEGHAGDFEITLSPDTVPEGFQDNAQEPPEPQRPESTVNSGMELASLVWILGAAVLGIHGLLSYLRLKRRVRNAVIWEEGVWVCSGLDTAFVLGFFRPQIYLPVLSEQERELVLGHERCHLRRRDHWWKLAAYCAVCVHWFNPMAWVTYVLLCRDMEMACDQETVKHMSSAQRKAYSAALLNCAAKRSGIAVCPVAFGEISVKARIKTVLNYKKPAFWVTVVAVILAAAVGVFFLTEPADDPVEKLYQKLDELQAAEAVHLEIDMSIDSNYDGWDTCNQEYLKSGEDCYRVFDYETSRGGYETSYVNFRGVSYAREYYEEGTVPESEWERLSWEMNHSLPLLTCDWRALEVLDVFKEVDGAAIITIQGDLKPTEDTVYQEKTYEFHMTADGELDYLVTRSAFTKEVREAGVSGSFDFREVDMIRFSDTNASRIAARIQSAAEEASAAIYSDDTQDVLQELELAQEEVKLAKRCYDAYAAVLHATTLHMVTNVEDSWYSGTVVICEGFYSGLDCCFEEWNMYSDTPVLTQAVRVGASIYGCITQGALQTGWQPQDLSDRFSFNARSKLDSWDLSGLLSAKEEGSEILLTFSGEPGSYAQTDYITVDGYTVRFRFEGERLAEVKWEYDQQEEGIHGTSHRVETYTFPDTSADEIRLKIYRMSAESYTPCTFSFDELVESVEEQWHVLQQGFVNTTPETIVDREDAVRIAERELKEAYHSSSVFYDPQEEIWMVVFGVYSGDFLVLLNADGTTRMTIDLGEGTTFGYLVHTCGNPEHHHKTLLK